MTVECPACKTIFPVDPNKIPPGGVHARCSKCSQVFFVEPPPARRTPETEVVEPFHAPESDAVGPEGVDTVEQARSTAAEPEAAVTEDLPVERDLEEPEAAEPESEPVSEVTWSEEAAEPEPEPSPEEPWAPEAAADEPEPEAAEPEPEPEPLHADPEPEYDRSEPTFGDPEPTFSMDSPTLGAASGGSTLPEPIPAERDTAPTPTPLFGRRDPKEKAQRLARVLVSDIILYNPDRHRMALNTGRAREEFTEEIQKSWVEYVEQVGEEIATSTPFFEDALTEILEGGPEIS